MQVSLFNHITADVISNEHIKIVSKYFLPWILTFVVQKLFVKYLIAMIMLGMWIADYLLWFRCSLLIKCKTYE